MPLKAVLFDLGLTLIRTASFPEIYKQILAHFEITVKIEDIIQAQKATENEFDTSTYTEENRKEFWTNYNVAVLKKLGVEKNAVFVAAQIDELWWDCSHVQLYPDAESTLFGLKSKGLKIGLVSNGFKQDLDRVLGELDLKKWFDAIVCIDSCNCAKPSKEIFLYALDQLEIKANEAIFVGDSILYDYEGATRVGIKPYLIDREKKPQSKYDTIASLTELLSLV
ncbi:MAG: HAD family hydrolase [Candidatus Bathyarchaeota archaeon]|nr:HAD family hydrolase [Candidatus Bathyarchaeum sp.]